MKVVLFCGGLGLRLRDYSDKIPKPLVPVGGKPILWHIMKYYAHFGHKDFILCLGYKAEAIKNYFVDYEKNLDVDFVLASGQREALHNDIADWRITFVDTGYSANIGERLKKVEYLVRDEPYFLAHYSDTITDAPLNSWIEHFKTQNKVASMMCVQPHVSLHSVEIESCGTVSDIRSTRSQMLINGGFFILRQDIFEHIGPGEELVEEPFKRLIAKRALLAQHYEGFWATMDTFKDRQSLEEAYRGGNAPWEIWKKANQNRAGLLTH